MDKIEYEERIKALEDEIKVMKERYRILAETTPALLFEYLPREDKMIFSYNFPDNKKRKEIEEYRKFLRKSPLVHPDHLQMFMNALLKASRKSTKGELEYLSKVSTGEFQWHKTYYSSIADETGKVISVLGRIHNVHESATRLQKMAHRIETDSLTGLYNKEAAEKKITKWLKDYPTREAYLVMLDFDNFKQVNDLYGHNKGDEVLKEAAEILATCFDDDTLVARPSGDEFIVFLTDESIGFAESKVDMMMQKLESNTFQIDKPLQFSAGIAARASKYDDFNDLFNRADSAMYDAKKAGKNCYFIYKDR